MDSFDSPDHEDTHHGMELWANLFVKTLRPRAGTSHNEFEDLVFQLTPVDRKTCARGVEATTCHPSRLTEEPQLRRPNAVAGVGDAIFLHFDNIRNTVLIV